MKKIIYNENNLTDKDITEKTIKVKALIINSKDEIMLGYSYNTYQFPGGTLEEGETLIDTLNREIEEETGINLKLKDIEPFLALYGYYKDYPDIGKNKKVEIYYYEIKTDELPKLNNTNYTDSEKKGNFKLKTIPLEDIENELNKNVSEFGDSKGIAKEMLTAIKFYKDSKI